MSVFALVVAGVIGSATAASAHHPEITATGNCDSTVSFSAAAWAGEGTGTALEQSRTHGQIEIAWSTTGTGGTFTALPDQSSYEFAASTGYAFSGTFAPNGVQPGTIVTVRATAVGPWANGQGGGEVDYATATIPAPCTPVVPAAPTVTIACPSGLVSGQPATWTATVTKDATDTVTLQWSKNGTPMPGQTGTTLTTTVVAGKSGRSASSPAR